MTTRDGWHHSEPWGGRRTYFRPTEGYRRRLESEAKERAAADTSALADLPIGVDYGKPESWLDRFLDIVSGMGDNRGPLLPDAEDMADDQYRREFSVTAAAVTTTVVVGVGILANPASWPLVGPFIRSPAQYRAAYTALRAWLKDPNGRAVGVAAYTFVRQFLTLNGVVTLVGFLAQNQAILKFLLGDMELFGKLVSEVLKGAHRGFLTWLLGGGYYHGGCWRWHFG